MTDIIVFYSMILVAFVCLYLISRAWNKDVHDKESFRTAKMAAEDALVTVKHEKHILQQSYDLSVQSRTELKKRFEKKIERINELCREKSELKKRVKLLEETANPRIVFDVDTQKMSLSRRGTKQGEL